MTAWICRTCGVQHEDTEEPPSTCAICLDERQYVGHDGQRWTRRARQVDTVEAALVGACDGELTVLQILDALADLLEQDAAEVRAAYLPVVRGLVTEGFLVLGATGQQAENR